MSESKWLEFKLALQKEKTQVWHIFNKGDGEFLGEIKWYSQWRQYTFFPEPDTVFAGSCIDDIAKFIKNLMDERK